jgi:hypothetical protein
MPEPATVSLSVFDSGHGTVKFATGQTGMIKLICPVSGLFATGNGSNPDRLDIAFYDTDTTNDNCYVEAYLQRREVQNPDAGATLITSYVSAYDSTLQGASPYNYRNWETTDPFSHTFNFDAYFYWVQVNLYRNVTTCNVETIGLRLSSTFN